MTPAVPAHLAMNAPLSEREPGVAWTLHKQPADLVVNYSHSIFDGQENLVILLDAMPGHEDKLSLIVRAVNSIDAVEAERDQLREAMKGATVIANQSGALLRELDAKIEALVKALEEIIGAVDSNALQMNSAEIGEPENGIPMHQWHEQWLHYARKALTAAKGPAS